MRERGARGRKMTDRIANASPAHVTEDGMFGLFLTCPSTSYGFENEFVFPPQL